MPSVRTDAGGEQSVLTSQQSQIRESMALLDVEVDGIAEAVKQLYDRLTPILRIASSGTVKDVKVDSPPYVPLAEDIRSFIQRLYKIDSDINDILTRLEL